MHRTLKFHLHLGAHKTATTFLQKHLSANKDRLLQAGTIWKGPEDIRPTLLRYVRELRHAGESYQSPTHDYDSACAVFAPQKNASLEVFSDENLIGTCRKALGATGLYPQLSERLSILARIAPEPPSTVFLSIRNMNTWLVSAYCEALQGARRFFTFNRYMADVPASSLLWRSVVERIIETFPTTRLVVWRFEDLQWVMPELLNLLVGPKAAGEITPMDILARERTSFSRKGVKELRRTSTHLRGEAYRAAAQKIKSDFPKDARHKALSPALLLEHDYDELYAKDAKEIGRLAHVTMLLPTH